MSKMLNKKKKKLGKAGLAALSAGSVIGGLGGNIGISAGLMKTVDNPKTSKQEADKLVSSYVKKHKLEDMPIHRDEDSNISSKFAPKVIEKVLKAQGLTDDSIKSSGLQYGAHIDKENRNPAVAIHELGHARLNKNLGKFGDVFSGVSRYPANPLAMPIGLGAMGALGYHAGKKEAKGKKLNKVEKFIDKHPFIVSTLPHAGQLLDEGQASVSATRHMVKEKGLKEGLKASSSLLPAFGTYATLAGAQGLGGGFAYKYGKRAGQDAHERKMKRLAEKLNKKQD